MAETVTHFLQESGIPAELIIFIISLLPILELRGGMLAATILHVPFLVAAPICIIANMIPVPFIIFFIERILRYLKDHGPIKRFARWIEAKGMKKGAEFMEKHPEGVKLGLFLFVAIPLPGTGAWTGSLIAALMGLPPKKSAPFICLGVVGACAIMSVLTYLIPGLFGW